MSSTFKLEGGGFVGRGNWKLGARILTWSLPAVHTCPGRTRVCTEKMSNGRLRCYATQGLSGMQQSRYYANHEASLKPEFADRLVGLLTGLVKGYDTIRLHPSGDLYSPEYAAKWVDVMRRCPSQRFYLYTRSHRVSGFDRVLREMASLSNVSVWYSLDRDTGRPAVIPPRVRTCYLAVDDADAASVDPGSVDLVFRDYPSRDTVLMKVNGVTVCPHENGKTSHMTCERCRICIKPSTVEERRVEGGKKRRIPLALA